jgi:hypothetical protein
MDLRFGWCFFGCLRAIGIGFGGFWFVGVHLVAVGVVAGVRFGDFV